MKAAFRFDANGDIGMGHMARCVELARVFQRGGAKVIFIIGRLSLQYLKPPVGSNLHVIEDRLGEIDDAERCLSLVDKDSLLFVDHYQLKSQFDRMLSSRVALYANVVDDPDRHYVGHVIFNQNMGSELYWYDKEPYTKLIAGSRYTIVRDEFVQNRDFVIRDHADRLLLLVGAAPDMELTLSLLAQVGEIANKKRASIEVVASPACREVQRLAAACERHERTILRVGVTDMAAVMKRADLCITYCGSTVWELAAVGLPTVLYSTVSNHVKRAQDLDRAGVCLNIGWLASLEASRFQRDIEHLMENSLRRGEMSQKARRLIDGKGKNRAAQALREIYQRLAAD